MTIAADGFHHDRAERRRWAISLAVVLLLHVAAGLYLASRRVPLDAGGTPPAAVMIDLTPLPVPQPAPPQPLVEPQVQPQVEPSPPPPEPEIPLPKVEPSPAPRPAVVLPKPPPKPKPLPRPVERPPEAQPERPPPAAPPPAATAPPAPVATPPAVNAGVARASWQAQLVGWLQRYKRYPRLAQEQRQEGEAYLRFTMDRAGHVLSAQLEKGSGFSLLDEEVMALIQRAQPLPAPPPEIPGAQLTLTLPVEFSLRTAR